MPETDRDTQWIHIIAAFTGKDTDLAEELLTDIFITCGVKGVICTVPITAPDDGFGGSALPAPEENAVEGYLPDVPDSRPKLKEIEHRARRLGELGIVVDIRTGVMDPQDWSEAWKSHFFVTRLTDRIVVKPTWRAYDPEPDDLIIHMDPGMAFGAGTHPTTAMCVALIETLISPGDTLLDVGTGSGILMIAAALLGASRLTGIDIDPVAIETAQKNLDGNQIPEKIRQLVCTSVDHLDQDPEGGYHLVVANIMAEVILDIRLDLTARVRPGGGLILSGIIQEKYPAVQEAMEALGFSQTLRKTDGEWVAASFRAPVSAGGNSQS